MRASTFPLIIGATVSVVCLAQTPQLTVRAANRILEQATWGPTQAATTELQQEGFQAWFQQQVAAPISTYADEPLLNAQGKTNANVAPVQLEFFRNALTGADQLRQRVAFALSEIWVVSNLEVANASAFPPLLRIFQQRAFDNYEQLMKDITLNPGMGRYLNMVNNDKGNPSKGTSANENYAREIMQLFTMGLTQLHDDGSPVLDQNGNPVPTYRQEDVTNLARAFTGWVYGTAPGIPNKGHNPVYDLVPMVPYEIGHDTTTKQILGVTLSANQSAEQDLDDALHIVFMQPSVPGFVSQQLIQHLVTSNPSPPYVQRVAEVFKDNGSGVRGDLQAVVYAILNDSEARAGDQPNAAGIVGFGHMREPVLLCLNLLRGLGGSLSNTSIVAAAATALGQNLLDAPSVFSYFSPQYRTSSGLPAPEFQIYSTQTAAARANLINSAIYGGQFDSGTKFNISVYLSAAATATNALIDLINQEFFHQDMSSELRDAILQALQPLTVSSDKAKAALYVALTSSEYQIIH
jgi:uncharacterized protein (DUF1800 family)